MLHVVDDNSCLFRDAKNRLLSVTGGHGLLSYNWSNGDTTFIANNLYASKHNRMCVKNPKPHLYFQ